MTPIDSQARIKSCINLLTTTTLTERNYYALYVDNAKVGYICAIWNRFIFLLFGGFDWCLGSAADTKRQVFMQHEIILIDHYNRAKKELLGTSTSDVTSYEKACNAYKQALNARLSQMTNRFGFSQEAMQLNLRMERKEILQAAKCDLIDALHAQNLTNYKTQFLANFFDEDETSSTDEKVGVKSSLPPIEKDDLKETMSSQPPVTPTSSCLEEDDEPYLQLSTSQPSVSTKWEIGKLLYQEDAETARGKSFAAEAALFQAFKENASKIQTLEDLTVTKVIPEEIIHCYAHTLVKCHLSNAQTIEEAFKRLDTKYAQTSIAPKCHMILMTVIIKHLFSFAITLNSDALFTPRIQQHFGSFVKAFTPETSVKYKFCYATNPLKSMFRLIKTLYKHIHPDESEQTCNQFAHTQLMTLLKYLYTDKFILFETYFAPEKLKTRTSEEDFLFGLYQAMHYFKPDASAAQKAALTQFSSTFYGM